MKVVWQGTEELNAKLKKIVQNFPREKNLFLMQTAENLMARAKKFSPVDTGKLRGSWSRSEPQGDSVEVFNNTEYAAHVEFGHRTRGGGGFVPGQHFLRDAVDESRENFVRDANNILARLFR